MKYTVVSYGDKTKFIDEVNKYLSEGWQCIGGVAIDRQTSEGRSRAVFHQAMVKEEYVNPTDLLPMSEKHSLGW